MSLARRAFRLLTRPQARVSPVGRYGTITTHGDINPPYWGEVRVSMSGGTEYFNATSADDKPIMAGEEVVVVAQEALSSRHVIVARATD